jgi:hypothetical protein
MNGTPFNSAAFSGGNKIFQIACFGGTYAPVPTLNLSTTGNRPRNVPRGHPEAHATLSEPALLRPSLCGGAAVE